MQIDADLVSEPGQGESGDARGVSSFVQISVLECSAVSAFSCDGSTEWVSR